MNIKASITALLITLASFVTTAAEAHHRHHHFPHVATYAVDPNCNVPGMWPCAGVVPSPRGERVVKAMHGLGVAKPVYIPSQSSGYGAGRPSRYISGRLICAVNVNAALAERGIKGTGSALAMSFRTWGRSAGGPVPGAVIVSARRGGGHVAIVSRVENGIVYAWNATGGQSGWREIPYRHHVIDYRVPG